MKCSQVSSHMHPTSGFFEDSGQWYGSAYKVFNLIANFIHIVLNFVLFLLICYLSFDL